MKQENHCIVCKKLLEKKDYESWKHYGTRKYCSHACQYKNMRIEKTGWFDPQNRLDRRPAIGSISGYYEDY